MKAAVGKWLLLACCIFVAASAAQDNVLRFLNHKEVVRLAQQKHSDDMKAVFSGGYKGDLPMEKFRAKSIVCPSGITQCPDSSTCCPLSNGQYGCCEGVNAVCCKDGVHCCPKGFKCDEEHGRCTSETRGISFHWVDNKVLRAEPLPHIAPNNTCRDNKTKCLPNDVCCPARNNTFGCCPFPKGVCCPDLLHCCPVGTKCDIQRRRCFRGEGDWEVPWVERRPPKPEPSHEVNEAPSSKAVSKIQAVICKDGLLCPDGSTCCLLKNGSYGCCSFPDKERTPISDSVRSVVCPGGAQQCPDGNTCCVLASGQYGCCPLPNAVCCPDEIHCCPTGYTCDTHSCKQSDGQHSVPWSVKTPAVSRNTLVRIKCPNGGYCSDGNTCCLLPDGSYGCCPYPQAVCCSDKLHCCPHGFTCELATQSCKNTTISIPWQKKKPAVSNVQTVICPDGKSECPDGSTCCVTTSGGYGCCPYQSAVCCSDHIHCCPDGTTCDVAHITCKKGQDLIPWEEKMPALQRVRSVVCPGGQSACPDGQTCCKEASGRYGCCPLPNAVCCSDHIHCCPNGTTCNLAQSTCQQGQEFIPWEEKTPALQRVRSVVCPGGESECPDGQTCCVQTSGKYGCCPLPDAVCCSDHLHCCPQGYTCNLQTQSCDQGLTTVPWVKKRSALPSLP